MELEALQSKNIFGQFVLIYCGLLYMDSWEKILIRKLVIRTNLKEEKKIVAFITFVAQVARVQHIRRLVPTLKLCNMMIVPPFHAHTWQRTTAQPIEIMSEDFFHIFFSVLNLWPKRNSSAKPKRRLVRTCLTLNQPEQRTRARAVFSSYSRIRLKLCLASSGLSSCLLLVHSSWCILLSCWEHVLACHHNATSWMNFRRFARKYNYWFFILFL